MKWQGDRRLATALAGLVLAASVHAQDLPANPRPGSPQLPGTPARVFPHGGAGRSVHASVPVPPTLEIEILDPNVDPRGNPAVVARSFALPTPSGPEPRVALDIPPVVLVHRYYYTGDRSFQAQFLPGGPSIVVANHPKTGERLYIPLQMLPGAPRVTYADDFIRYDYGAQAITIEFCWLHERPKVVYRQGVPLTERAEMALAHTTEATRRLLDRTGLPALRDRVAEGARSVVQTSADRTNALGRQLLGPPTELVRRTPFANLFTSSQEDRASRDRASEVRRVETEFRREDGTIPTNR